VAESIVLPDETIPVFLISQSDLIRSKRQTARPKDLDDIEHLDP
jgi:hypothetical protein